MKKFLVIIFSGFTFLCSAQNNDAWYKMLSGTIDKYPVTMHLYKFGHNYKGYYYYISKQVPFAFTGNDTTLKNTISLDVSADDKEEYFEISLHDKSASGTWKQDKKSALQVSLTEVSMPVNFIFSNLEDSVKLRKGLKNSPQATFQAACVWPAGISPTDIFIRQQILKLFSKKQMPADVTALLQSEKRSFFADYVKENKDVKKEDLKDRYESYNYDESENLLINYQTEKIISFAFDTYSFTGGAHGIYGTSYVSLDVIHKKALRINDILNKNGIAKLQALLENSFRRQANLKPADSLMQGGLFENKILPNKNFYVTGKGLSFVYNPYEIGPYAMGEIAISISFKELQNYLLPQFKKLIQ